MISLSFNSPLSSRVFSRIKKRATFVVLKRTSQMIEQLVPFDYEEELLEDENIRATQNERHPRTFSGLLLLERPVNELWKLKETSGNISSSEIMRTSRTATAAAKTSVGSYWISSITSTAFSLARRNVVEIAQLLLSPFSARSKEETGCISAALRPTIRHRPESFSSSRMRNSESFSGLCAYPSEKPDISHNYRRRLPEAA